mmetsp:Transcript_59252/g.166821  ORF Transcript_59252/g.166821 Transcript_59252/m.166821 type:complete len:211 (+) Transcript_59252:604-1236(+)
MKPRSSTSESWHCCTDSCRIASRNFLTSSVGCGRCFSSAWFPMWMSAFSTASRSGAFACTSSWSSWSSARRLFAAMLPVMPCSSSSSCFASASAFSLAIVEAFSANQALSNMCGITVQQARTKYSTSTSPFASGCRMLRITCICILDRQSWSALSSTCLSSQMDMMLSPCRPPRRHSRIRWTRSEEMSVSTRALWRTSMRSCCRRQGKSS